MIGTGPCGEWQKLALQKTRSTQSRKNLGKQIDIKKLKHKRKFKKKLKKSKNLVKSDSGTLSKQF